MKMIVIDIDGTVCLTEKRRYSDAVVIEPIRRQLQNYREAGFKIALHTSRNVQTYSGNIGMINAYTVPVLIEWLNEHDIPYDELHVGKPWCGTEGFYVDDRAIRPDEFATLAYGEVQKLLADSADRIAELHSER